MPTKTRQRGVTVIEAAIVAAIGSTLLAAASPELAQFVANSQLRSVAEDLRRGLRIAQVEALSRQVPVELVLTDDVPDQAGITPRAAGRNWIVRAVDGDRYELIRSFRGEQRSPRVRMRAERSVFAFDAFGRLRGETAGADVPLPENWQIEIEDRESIARPLRVVVTPGGSSTACDPAAAPTDSFACG